MKEKEPQTLEEYDQKKKEKEILGDMTMEDKVDKILYLLIETSLFQSKSVSGSIGGNYTYWETLRNSLK